MEDREHVVETHVRESFDDVVAALGDAVAGVTANWPADGVTDPDRVRADVRTALELSGVRDRLPSVLAAAVAELDASMAAAPVAAPPYVVATSEGVLLRATLDDARLVITLGVVTRTDGRYRPQESVDVAARIA